jgi:hypothetical protein
MIKPMILSSGNITVGINTVMNHTEPMQAMQYAQNQYVRFYTRFIQSLDTLSANGFTANQQPSEWVSAALRQINLGKTPASPWANSGPDGPKAGYTYLRSTAPTWVPPTGTRLGITKAYIPTVYIQGPDLWIQCHDGARFVMAKDGLPLGSTVQVVLPRTDVWSRQPAIQLPTSALRHEAGVTSVWLLNPSSMTVSTQAVEVFTAEGNDNPDWLPKAGKQVAARVLIVPCLHKRQICYAKVVF